MLKILVVEDDIELNRTVCSFLRGHGYEAIGCFNADEAEAAFYESTFACVVSDIMLPGTDGCVLAEEIRSINSEIPIIFMTARDDFPTKQKSFGLGADDYMVKPVDLNELVLRIGALLRRAGAAAEKRLTVGSFVMDTEEHTAYLGEEEIPLTNREFDILYKLLSYPKKTFTRSQIMDEFWNMESETAPRAVDIYILKLRSKLADCTDFEIKTVHGLGYKAVLK